MVYSLMPKTTAEYSAVAPETPKCGFMSMMGASRLGVLWSFAFCEEKQGERTVVQWPIGSLGVLCGLRMSFGAVWPVVQKVTLREP